MSRQTAIDLLAHFFSSLIFSVIIYSKTNNPVYALIFILGGVFIDLDHLIDYFMYFKNKFNLHDFLAAVYLKSGKFHMFFHSWEISFIILLLSFILKSTGLFIFFLGLSIHLAIDNLQRQNPLLYFLVYRIYKKFNVNILLPEHKKN